MKYLFRVDNLSTNIGKNYSVEANNEDAAKSKLSEKFFPYFSITDFDTFVNSLANDMDIIISYLGPVDQIEEL